MIFRYLIGKTDDKAVRTERIKLLASGCQLIAVGIFISAIISPIFNPLITASLKTQIMGGVGFAVFELLAMRIMGYIPPPKED